MSEMNRRDFIKIAGLGLVAGVFSLAIQSGIGRGVGIDKKYVPGAGSLEQEQIDKIDPEKFLSACSRCGVCLSECPNNAIKYADGNYPRLTGDTVTDCPGYMDCGVCLSVCPTNAIGYAFEDLAKPKRERFE
jgi:ferredoxin-type protein NapG